MAKKRIRVGLLGSGFASRFHHDSFLKITGADIEVAGVYSPTQANREKFASERGIRAFSSYEELLGEVDLVDIVSPPYSHEEYVVRSAEAGKDVIVEKPFTGYFGPPDAGDDWRGDEFSKETMLTEAVASAKRMRDSVEKAGVKLGYAENWVYAPSVQKECEILRASKGQILWMTAEESHSGSGSPVYGIWRKAGGGSLMGKGCHPLTACLYLKQVEGLATGSDAIRPKTVSCRTHKITREKAYRDAGLIRTDYFDIEDYCQVHVTFTDGMVADIFSTEIVLGGVHNWLEVYCNNHRNRCNINPVDGCVLYNPIEAQLEDVYLTEKLGTKQGWSFPSPDEDWMTGYPQETQDFVNAIVGGPEPQCGLTLGCDTVAVVYAAYVSDERGGAEVEVPQV